MPMLKHSLYDYMRKWQAYFPKPREVFWNGAYFENQYCIDCRLCCGEQDADVPFHLALLPHQIDKDTPNNFYLDDSGNAYLTKDGCKSIGENGCKLARAKRPIACELFPIVLINGGLYLYIRCPATIFTPLEYFFKSAMEIAEFLTRYAIEDLQRISNYWDAINISENFVDLGIQLFHKNNKTLIYY